MEKSPDVYNPTLRHYILVAPIFAAVRLLLATIRFKPTPAAAEMLSRRERIIGIAWHSALILLAKCKLFFRPKLDMAGLVSASRDAAYLVAFFDMMGIRSVRGSHKRRGRAAIVDLVETLKSGCDVFITPDGPVGPANVAKRGFYVVSEASGVRVAFLRFRVRHGIRIPSWDRLVVPLPFSAVDVESVEFRNVGELDAAAAKLSETAEQYASDYLNFKI